MLSKIIFGPLPDVMKVYQNRLHRWDVNRWHVRQVGLEVALVSGSDSLHLKRLRIEHSKYKALRHTWCFLTLEALLMYDLKNLNWHMDTFFNFE